MKALVFSDSHGQISLMETVLAQTSGHIDAVLHLGDGFYDLSRLKQQYNMEFYQVAGNCDPVEIQSDQPSYRLIILGGKRVLMTHGHMYAARAGVHRLALLAEEQQADICLYGHTHIPFLLNDGMPLIMNPGSISRPRGGYKPSYGVFEIDTEAGIHASVVEIRPDGFHILF